MKNLLKRLVAIGFAAALVCSLNVAAFAADAGYSAEVNGNALKLVKDGQTSSTYQLKTNDITISATKQYPLLLCFTDQNNKKMKVSLGGQRALNISGDIGALVVDASVDSSFKLSVGNNSRIEKLSVSSKENLSVADNAKIEKTVTTGKAASSNKAKTTGTAASANKNAVKLSIKTIRTAGGVTLAELTDALNDNVRATDTTKKSVSGECKWDGKTDQKITEKTTQAFTFYPHNTAYPAVKGKIIINMAGGSETITISYADYTSNSPLNAKSGDRLSDFTKQVKENISVKDEDGESIPYTFKWVSSPSTEFDGSESARAYAFTVTPQSKDFAAKEGAVYIGGGN